MYTHKHTLYTYTHTNTHTHSSYARANTHTHEHTHMSFEFSIYLKKTSLRSVKIHKLNYSTHLKNTRILRYFIFITFSKFFNTCMKTIKNLFGIKNLFYFNI